MPDRLDFDSARDVIARIAPTDTWDEATVRATADSFVLLDSEDRPERPPRNARRQNLWLAAVAACLLAAVAIAAVVANDPESVEIVPPAGSPTTECPDPTQPRAITAGGQMRNRFAAPVAGAATAVMLLGACNDDGPTTVAHGEDIELEGSDPDSLGGQTLQIEVQEDDGTVTGEYRVTNIVNTVECVDTDTEGFVILGGRVTTTDPDAELAPAVGDLSALVIKEGDPDSVMLYGNDVGAESCTELLESIPADLLASDGPYVDVESGDIETG
jgi:hypothetical protein